MNTILIELIKAIIWFPKKVLSYIGSIFAIIVAGAIIIAIFIFFTSTMIFHQIGQSIDVNYSFHEELLDSVACEEINEIYKFKNYSNQEMIERYFEILNEDKPQLQFDTIQNLNVYFDDWNQATLSFPYYKLSNQKQDELRNYFKKIVHSKDSKFNSIRTKIFLLRYDYLIPPLTTKQHYFTDYDIKLLNELHLLEQAVCEGEDIKFKDNQIFFTEEGIKFVNFNKQLRITFKANKDSNEKTDVSIGNITVNYFDLTSISKKMTVFDKGIGTVDLNGTFLNLFSSAILNDLDNQLSKCIKTIKTHDGAIEIGVKKGGVDERIDFIIKSISNTNIFSEPSLSSNTNFNINKNALFYCLDEINQFYYVKDDYGREGWISKYHCKKV